MDKYAIYLRKSRADLELEQIGKFETLRLHEERLTALAEQRQLVVSEIFRELVSGDSIASRPEMQRLLEKVRAGVFRGVLVTEVSRLARGDGIDQGTVSQAFKSSGTLIITPEKIYDPTSPLDEDFFDFSLFMARQEYKFIRRRMQAAVDQIRAQGYYLYAQTPFGYEKDGKRMIVPKEPEASMVRRAYADHLAGVPVYTILLKFESEGFKISNTSVWRLLKNPVYCGKIYFKGELIQGLWEPLVSVDDFEAAQRLFIHPRSKHKFTQRDPLAGLLRCSECGRCIHWDSHYSSQNPGLRHDSPLRCQFVSSTTPVVMDALADALKEVVREDSVVVRAESDPPDLDRMNSKMSVLRGQLNRAYEAYEAGVYSLQEFASRREDLQNQIKAQEDAIAAAADAADQAARVVEFRATVSEALADLKNWRHADPVPLNRFLKSFIKEIRYTRRRRSDPLELEIVFKD